MRLIKKFDSGRLIDRPKQPHLLFVVALGLWRSRKWPELSPTAPRNQAPVSSHL